MAQAYGVSKMRWVAPTEKDDAIHRLEKRLWDAVDQFRERDLGCARLAR